MTITSVEDPSKYGVVAANESTGMVSKFFEKPKEFISNKVNAGLYIFNVTMLDRIELKPHYLERDVFPRLAEEGQLYCTPLKGFWMDIGQPKDYMTGTKYYL